MDTWLRTGAFAVTLFALGLGLSGCGGSQDVEAGDAAERFHGAVADGDGTAACALLTPSTRSELEQSSRMQCEAAILEEVPDDSGDERGEVRVFGTMAQVRWGQTTVFLTRMPDGWRVLAAGCVARADAQYDCAVKGA